MQIGTAKACGDRSSCASKAFLYASREGGLGILQALTAEQVSSEVSISMMPNIRIFDYASQHVCGLDSVEHRH